jgi:hypothetical protein
VRKGVEARKMARLTGDGVLATTGTQANQYADNIHLVTAVLVAGTTLLSIHQHEEQHFIILCLLL